MDTDEVEFLNVIEVGGVSARTAKWLVGYAYTSEQALKMVEVHKLILISERFKERPAVKVDGKVYILAKPEPVDMGLSQVTYDELVS